MTEFGPRLILTGSVMCCSTCSHVFFPNQEDDMSNAFTDHIRKAHPAKDDPSQALDEGSNGLHNSLALSSALTGSRLSQQIDAPQSIDSLAPEKTPLVILCVDDDPAGLATRRMVLSLAGYHVLTAVSGEGAFRLLRRKHVDLVITDYFLPGMNGAELTVAVKATNPKLPVIVLTGAVDTPPGCEVADSIVIKGKSVQEFLTVIAKLIVRK